LGIECKGQCSRRDENDNYLHLLEDHHNFEGIGYYCRTCENYQKLEFLRPTKRCGCCNSKVRFHPRYDEANKRKVQARRPIKAHECTRCGSTETRVRKSSNKPRWTKNGECFKCYQELKREQDNLNIIPLVS
jgi:hypothetical protein